MTVCGGMKSVKSVCGNVNGGMETEGYISSVNVVVYSFRQTDYVESFV